MPRRKKDSGVPLQFLYGSKAPPESVVKRGMLDLENELTRQFRQERKVALDVARHQRRISSPLIESLKKSRDVAAAVRRLRALHASLGRKRRLGPPKYPKDETRIFPGSIGATVAPPFNYQWTWNATSGGPTFIVSANRNTGQMGFDIFNDNHEASGTARAAVGIYFRPHHWKRYPSAFGKSGVHLHVVDLLRTCIRTL